MALICDIKERIFTYEGKDYTYDEMRAMLYDGLLETVLKPAAAPAAAPAAPAPGTMAANEQEDAARRREIDAILDEELGPVPSERPISTGRLNTDKALKALRGLGVKIIAPGNEQEYQGAIKQFPDGVKSSWGLYDHATRTIYINPAGPDLRNTLFHESAHPVLAALFHNNPALREKFFSQIGDEKMPGSDMTYRQYGDRYADKSIAVRMEESIAQFTADVIDGKVKVSTKPDSLWQRFKDFVQDILAALGWDTRSIDLSKPDNVREFAAQFKKAMDKGIRITGLTPVDGTTLSLQDDADRLVDGWYSRLDQAVAAKGNTQSGADWMKWAEARAKEGLLSMEEVKWTGLADFLQGKAKVTPKEVREFLKENRVKVEVRVLSRSKPALNWKRYDLGEAGFYAHSDVGYNIKTGTGLSEGKIEVHSPTTGYAGSFATEEQAMQYAEDLHQESLNTGVTPRFSEYQLPGGTNYREVLVTLPVKGELTIPDDWDVRNRNGRHEVYNASGALAATGNTRAEAIKAAQPFIPEWKKKRIARGQGAFVSSHFDEPNILVHLRLNDRTGPNGEKILFIEELQSDWGQEGKKKEFIENALTEKQVWAGMKEKGFRAVKNYNSYNEWSVVDANGKEFAVGDTMDGVIAVAVSHEKSGLLGRRAGVQGAQSVPTAPFVTSSDAWVELGIKQAIRMAVDGGYDRIAWTTGEQQYDRWGSQVFSWTKRGDNWYVLGQEQAGGDVFAGMEEQLSEQAFSEGRQVESRDDLRELVLATMGREKRDWSPENWEKHIDKITDGIWQQMKDGKDGSTMPRREGMKGFYDKILPTVAKKVSKRLGGDGVVSEALIDGVRKSEAPATYNQEDGYQPGDDVEFVAGKMPQQSISITPEMRERVGLGVPLMQRPKTAGADVVARGGVSEMQGDEAFNGIEEPKTPIGDTKTVMVDGKERTVLNSNGKPIHPTVEGVRNFWRWFGDSKVVDAKGRPLVVYHGTPSGGFDEFDLSRTGSRDPGWVGRGFYFTTDRNTGIAYAQMGRGDNRQLYELYAKAENPFEWGPKDTGAYGLVMQGNPLPGFLQKAVYERTGYKFVPSERMSSQQIERTIAYISRAIRDELISRGYDSVITTYEDGGYELMTLDSAQLKSATGNYGRFDPSKRGISEMRSAPSPAGIPANRWNAMVENIRTGFQLELSAAEVMAELKSAGMLKGLSEPQRAALEAKLKQVEKRIASVAKRTGQTKEDIAPAQVKTDESQKVTQAEKLRQSIRRATGASAKDRRANEVNELAREFSMYRPPKDQLDEYIKMAEALKATLEGVKTARVSGKQGPYPLQNIDISNYDPALSNKELRDYNEKLAKLEQDRLDEQLLKDFEKARIEQGLEPASLSIGEVRSIMQSMKAKQAESDAIEKNAEATKKLEVFRLVASMKMQELQDAIKSGALKLDKAKQAIVDNLLKIDAKGLRAAEAAFMANGINNILINDSWGGMQAFAAKGWRDVAVKKIGTMLGRYGKSMVKQRGSLDRLSFESSEIWAVAEKIFGRENAADMRSILGINGILNGSAMSSRDADAAINERNKYAKSVGYKDTLYNRYLAGAYAYLIQAKGSTREELEASYDRRMRALEGSAANIFSSETISRKLDDANIDKDLYTRVVRDLIGNSPSLQDLSVPEPIRKMVEWEIAKHEESYAARSFAALTMYNKSVGRENNYTAQRMINVRTPEASRTGYDILEESVGKSMFSLSVAERMASQKQERVGWAEDQVIDLDFFSVQDRARRADLFDTYASPYIAQFREVISDPRLSGVISADAKRILIERVKHIIGADQRNELDLSDPHTRIYLKTSQRFAGIALKGVSQWFKQPTVLMSTALNIRDAGILADAIKDAMATHDDRNGGTWQHNIAKTQTIYERSRIVGGTEKIGQAIAKTALLSGNETSQEAGIKRFGAEMGRTADAVTKYTIGKPDAIAATITWWAFYRKYLKDNGVDLTRDDWKQQIDESAAAYATQEQERAQSSNLPEAGAPMYRGNLFKKMILDWMFAYSKFNVNSVKRAAADFRAIRLGAPETKKNAGIDLAARYVEQALFHAVSIAMRNFGRYVIASAIVDALTGTEAEPEDEEKEAAWYTRALVLAGYDFILTGMPDDISNIVFKPTLNKMINEMEGDTGRIKMNYDFFYVPNDGAVNGVMSAGWDEFGNIVRTLNVRSGYIDPEDEEARKLARLSVFLSAMHLMGISDQMLTRSIVSEANRRLKDRALPEGRRLMNEKFVMSNLGELTARGLYHLSGEEEE